MALETAAREKKLYRIVKGRTKAALDIGQIKYVRVKEGDVLTEEAEVRNGSSTYFSELIDEENPRQSIPER